MSQNPAFDHSIPVLTEVFSDKADKPAAPARLDAAPLADQANADLETRAIDNWTEPQWNLLERRLSERILQQLQGRVDFVLEQRLRDSLEEILKAAIGGLAEEIRAGLHDTIEKIVVRAVGQEVSHLQTLKK
ncbi:hypothetical protein [Massilia sp. TWP1-3-3]|uniref:hypothetical protein n=1 Tax=Massilia sp. TWP1-3-3 TaxID=2804573 RepID=UPI003CF0F08C